MPEFVCTGEREREREWGCTDVCGVVMVCRDWMKMVIIILMPIKAVYVNHINARDTVYLTAHFHYYTPVILMRVILFM